MAGPDPKLEPFDALIGTWSTEATHPLIGDVVPGRITFEWLEGGRFLIQRWSQCSTNDSQPRSRLMRSKASGRSPKRPAIGATT